MTSTLDYSWAFHQRFNRFHDTGVVSGKSGRTYEVRDAIDQEEGDFLFNLIRRDPTICRTLEVGCAHGVSSLYICSAIRGRDGASHTISILSLSTGGIRWTRSCWIAFMRRGSRALANGRAEESHEDRRNWDWHDETRSLTDT